MTHRQLFSIHFSIYNHIENSVDKQPGRLDINFLWFDLFIRW